MTLPGCVACAIGSVSRSVSSVGALPAPLLPSHLAHLLCLTPCPYQSPVPALPAYPHHGAHLGHTSPFYSAPAPIFSSPCSLLCLLIHTPRRTPLVHLTHHCRLPPPPLTGAVQAQVQQQGGRCRLQQGRVQRSRQGPAAAGGQGQQQGLGPAGRQQQGYSQGQQGPAAGGSSSS